MYRHSGHKARAERLTDLSCRKILGSWTLFFSHGRFALLLDFSYHSSGQFVIFQVDNGFDMWRRKFIFPFRF
jgi:hypothetical protein